MTLYGRRTTIGDLINEVGGEVKTGPFGTALKASEYTTTGVPVISVGEIGHGEFHIHDRTPFVDESVTTRLPQFLLEIGDIVFARKGSVERSALVGHRQKGWFLGSDGIRLRLSEAVDSRFVRYWISSEETKHWLVQNSTGSTMASLNQATIKRLPIVLPSLAEQQEIASILGALDDKIELNRRMSATLEEMARSMYRSWFVDFDPVHAKMEGRQPAFMDEATAALFPDRFGGDGLPEGWTKVSYLDAVSIVGGGTPKTSRDDFWGGDIPWYSVVDAPSSGGIFVFKTEKTITEAGLKGSSARLLPPGATIISARGTVGKLAMVGAEMAFNQSCYGLLGKEGFGDVYTYFSTARVVELLQSMAHGSVFATITRKTFEGIEVTRCNHVIMDAFEAKAGALTGRMLSLALENQSLAALRDCLLPKLMSGEIRVGEAREQIEEVA